MKNLQTFTEFVNESKTEKYDGVSKLNPGTILKVGRYGQFKMEVIKDLGDEVEVKNITKNFKEEPFTRKKSVYKGDFILNESEIKKVTNKHGVTFEIGDIAKTPDKSEPTIKITGFTKGRDGHMKALYNVGMYSDVFNLDDLELNEAVKDINLFKINFNPVYVDGDNQPSKPVFAKLSNQEWSKIKMYAAVQSIGGFASYERFDLVPAKDRIGATEMSFPELLSHVKSLLKVKFHR